MKQLIVGALSASVVIVLFVLALLSHRQSYFAGEASNGIPHATLVQRQAVLEQDIAQLHDRLTKAEERLLALEEFPTEVPGLETPLGDEPAFEEPERHGVISSSPSMRERFRSSEYSQGIGGLSTKATEVFDSHAELNSYSYAVSCAQQVCKVAFEVGEYVNPLEFLLPISRATGEPVEAEYDADTGAVNVYLQARLVGS